MNTTISSLKDRLRAALYVSGAYGWLHRMRNRRTLTVFMFHRVLPADSSEFARAEREFTFSVEGFARCLDFVSKHYHVISLAELRSCEDRNTELPNRAALITFDDGWRDTWLHALPELRKRGIPGVLFLATEVVELDSMRWWQDLLVEVLESPGRAEILWEQLGLARQGENEHQRARILTARIGELPERERVELLSPFVTSDRTERQMLSSKDLPLVNSLLSVCGHGHSHVPLSESRTVACELLNSQRRLIDHGAFSDTMSFPHGAYTEEVVQLARSAGFRYLFSSDPCLVSTRNLQPEEQMIGRIHLPENQWTCDQKGISFPKLASFLFFRPIRPPL